MAVTTARSRQALAMRGVQEGELAGNRQVKSNLMFAVAKELPQWLIRRALQSRLAVPCSAGCEQRLLWCAGRYATSQFPDVANG